LKEARAKSQALKEVIAGNELFKNLNPESKESFKSAQSTQSPQTRKIVTDTKS
jgi:hypothetical protein